MRFLADSPFAIGGGKAIGSKVPLVPKLRLGTRIEPLWKPRLAVTWPCKLPWKPGMASFSSVSERL